MSGTVRLYAAVLISCPCTHPHGLSQAGRWMSCMLNVSKFFVLSLSTTQCTQGCDSECETAVGTFAHKTFIAPLLSAHNEDIKNGPLQNVWLTSNSADRAGAPSQPARRHHQKARTANVNYPISTESVATPSGWGTYIRRVVNHRD
jgi:hypothetical protein